jgi:dolichol kinase
VDECKPLLLGDASGRFANGKSVAGTAACALTAAVVTW